MPRRKFSFSGFRGCELVLVVVDNITKIRVRIMHHIDHRMIIANLPANERARLTSRADAPALVRMAAHGSLIVLFGWAIAAGVPGWQLLLVPQGIVIIFLFTLLHESSHDTAFASPWLNAAVRTACGFAVFIPAIWFRYFHFAHHRHTHDPQNDPELASPKPETVWQYVKYLSGVPLWISMTGVLLRNASGRNRDDFVPQKAKGRVAREAQLTIAAYAALVMLSAFLGSALLFWTWLVPALLGQPFLRAYLLAEHTLCPHVASMLENTRTTFTNKLVRFLAWNMPYHAEHHAFPAVPFHKLPDFHLRVREHLVVTENGYVQFHKRMLSAFG